MRHLRVQAVSGWPSVGLQRQPTARRESTGLESLGLWFDLGQCVCFRCFFVYDTGLGIVHIAAVTPK